MILMKDVGHESSMNSNQSDLVIGWTTTPDTSGTAPRSVRLGEYPLILSTKHFDQSHFVTIMFASEEALSRGRTILPVTCPVCRTPLIKDNPREEALCLRCNEEIASTNDLGPWQPLLMEDYYQLIGWDSEIMNNESTRLVSISFDHMRDNDTALLLNRCPDCGSRLTILREVISCLWCGRIFALEASEIRVAYHVRVSGSGYPAITFQKGGPSRSRER